MNIRRIAYLSVVLTVATLISGGCDTTGGQVAGKASPTMTLTDMLGRAVTMPKQVRRILALHPIPTTLLELLAPQQIVGVDSVLARSLQRNDARFSPGQLSALTTLPRTGVYFKGFDPEQLIKLHPDVVITMTGDTNIEREQSQTKVPFFAVSKSPTASYATTIRKIGEIVGNGAQSDQMAAFWADTTDSVQARTDTIPADRRPTVMFTGRNGDILGIPGKDTVFGSTIATAGGRYVGDALPPAHRTAENNPVSIEQIVNWDPDVIIAATTSVKTRMIADPRWQTLRAVRNGQIYVPPAYDGLDGLSAVLGMLWTQGVLLDHDDAHSRATLAASTQRYYTLFYGHRLTPAQIDQVAS